MDRWKRSIQIDDSYHQFKIEAYCYQMKIEDNWHKSKVEKYQGAEELPENFWPSLGLTPSAHKVVCSCTHQLPRIIKYIIGKIKITEMIGLSIMCHLMQAGAQGECRRIRGTDGSLQVLGVASITIIIIITIIIVIIIIIINIRGRERFRSAELNFPGTRVWKSTGNNDSGEWWGKR